MSGALEGTTIVALEQAVAAPLATARLADAGARVIKLERPEGDFARGYDDYALGQSSYFVWINRGKESCRVDLRLAADLDLVQTMLSEADVFVQNLAPGATDRLGIGSAALRAAHPRLIVCDIGAGLPAQGVRPSDPGGGRPCHDNRDRRIRPEPCRHIHQRHCHRTGGICRHPGSTIAPLENR